MRKYRLSLLVGIIIFTSSSVYAITTPEQREQEMGIDLYLEASNLDYTPPTRFQPFHHSLAPEEASFWIHQVLPYEEDRYEDMYLVIPGLGLITPIETIPTDSTDYSRMVNGQEIQINNYLKSGIIEYVNSVTPGDWGKRVDFGHSNYYKTDTGRYKTIFANLMGVEVNDQVWYFVKQPDGEYKLFKYLVTASYPTNPSNVQALQRDGEGADALIFGCYHGLDGRRMVEATYIGTPGNIPGQDDPRYDSLDDLLKERIKQAVKKIKFMEERKQAYTIVLFFEMFDKIRLGTISEHELLILDYMEEKLAQIYPEGF